MIKTRKKYAAYIRLFWFFYFPLGEERSFWIILKETANTHADLHADKRIHLVVRVRMCCVPLCTRSLHLFFYLQHIDMTSCAAIELLDCLIFDNWINSQICFIWNCFVFLSDPYSYRHFILFIYFFKSAILVSPMVWDGHQYRFPIELVKSQAS